METTRQEIAFFRELERYLADRGRIRQGIQIVVLPATWRRYRRWLSERTSIL